eukprot:TRINITY_DN5167_c0_g1_i1.p1 TRINITY_DN5167_c0_g1~~TRINITY_DN5167_c0_g1_i1.p1  ORF type:complete len:848 (-),score=150.78 TRINITY_DN5167_c0_g1_i1:1772-4315(-)
MSGRQALLECEATKRATQISLPDYQLFLDLALGSNLYNGQIMLTFECAHLDHDIFLDFTGKIIHSLIINDVVVQNIDQVWLRDRLHILSHIRVGQNKIFMKYTNEYDRTGAGLHQFYDDVDNTEYLYSFFAPFEAHRIFPCFDQPDIKGVFSLQVKVPLDWTLVSNEVIDQLQYQENSKLYGFKDTARISTYLYAIVAGPYVYFNNVYDDRIPLGIYARKSLGKYIDADEIFDITKKALRFYEEFFSTEYPFSKYDQVFVPEFNMGAMENVGCVTFSEYYIFRDEPTTKQRASRVTTIVHEMAHMWFGNLVTPVWWDGLWLNESFATYMASLCAEKATFVGDMSWMLFNTRMKLWAYREDLLTTSHPIIGKVSNTDQTFSNFDGITYGKGASVLKQLVYCIGMDKFKMGIDYYFDKYKWGNTTTDQFLEALSIGCTEFVSSSWKREWLESTGTNILKFHYEVDNNGIVSRSFVLQKNSQRSTTLRNHHCEIVAYNLVGDHLENKHHFRAHILPQRETDLDIFVGEELPDFVYINFNDHAFALVDIDENSTKFCMENMALFEDQHLRHMIWSAMYSKSRDLTMKPTTFLRFVKSNILHERDCSLVESILNTVHTTLIHSLPVDLNISESNDFFAILYPQIDNANTEMRVIYTKFSVVFACSAENVSILVNRLINKPQGFTQVLKWNIIVKACAFNVSGCMNLLSQEESNDVSDVGKRYALKAWASIPVFDNKLCMWNTFLETPTRFSQKELLAAMEGFFWWHQLDILDYFIDQFFANVRNVYSTRSKEFASGFMKLLFPKNLTNPTVQQKAVLMLESLEENEILLKRNLLVKIDDLRGTLKCIEYELS